MLAFKTCFFQNETVIISVRENQCKLTSYHLYLLCKAPGAAIVGSPSVPGGGGLPKQKGCSELRQSCLERVTADESVLAPTPQPRAEDLHCAPPAPCQPDGDPGAGRDFLCVRELKSLLSCRTQPVDPKSFSASRTQLLSTRKPRVTKRGPATPEFPSPDDEGRCLISKWPFVY